MTNPYDKNPYDGGTPDNGGYGGSTPNNRHDGDASGGGPYGSGYNHPDAGDAFNDSPGSQGYGADSYGVPMGDDRSAAAGGFPSMPDYEASAGTAPLAPSRPGPWIRLLSLIIDGIVVNVASAPIFLMLSSTQEVLDWLLNTANGINADMPTGIGIASLFSFVLWFVYRAAMESSGMKGSLGKLATGQRVVDFEGRQLTFVQSLKRNSFYLIQGLLSILPFLGFIYMIVYGVGISRDPYNQSHTDKWAKAYVVKAL
ncbi:RDD family protein [Corynebacterium sp.]|uniref:RDD family protein n=1 Tax=Corynebacterium sp. TaxID=1720 RepID=UPI00260BD757|nr:RDD family protein [Corynebacterium sp.]